METENIDIAIDRYYNVFEIWFQPLFLVIIVQSCGIMCIYHSARIRQNCRPDGNQFTPHPQPPVPEFAVEVMKQRQNVCLLQLSLLMFTAQELWNKKSCE